MKLLLTWLAALAVVTIPALMVFPPRPGPNNDMPVWFGLALVAYYSAVTAVATCVAVARRMQRRAS